MNPRPVNVKALNNYELLIYFQNGEQKIFDVKPLLSMPLYQPLKNINFFKMVKADGMCIYWNDCIDLCPDMVYTNSRPYLAVIEEVEPDEIERLMLKEIENNPDCHEFISSDELMKELEL